MLGRIGVALLIGWGGFMMLVVAGVLFVLLVAVAIAAFKDSQEDV